MKTRRYLAIVMLAVIINLLGLSKARIRAADLPEVMNWPPAGRECKPWAYWWWLASAVNEDDLTWNLQQYSKAGMGGMTVISIFGEELRVPRGYEDQYIDFLSAKWMAMLSHTTREAERLGLGIDMATGAAWNFGGPHVPAKNANYYVTHKTYELQGGARLDEKLDRDAMQALGAYSKRCEVVDLYSSSLPPMKSRSVTL